MRLHERDRSMVGLEVLLPTMMLLPISARLKPWLLYRSIYSVFVRLDIPMLKLVINTKVLGMVRWALSVLLHLYLHFTSTTFEYCWIVVYLLGFHIIFQFNMYRYFMLVPWIFFVVYVWLQSCENERFWLFSNFLLLKSRRLWRRRRGSFERPCLVCLVWILTTDWPHNSFNGAP